MASPWSSRTSFSQRVESSLVTPRQKLNYSSFLGDSISSTRAQSKSVITAQVLEETPHHRIETFGLPLPVQVSEILANQERSRHASVKIGESGWAWLVSGRKLLVWRYAPSAVSKGVYCKRLSLPSTELLHSAELVCIIPSFVGGESSSLSSVAIVSVSPEGLVRYWPNLVHDGTTIDLNFDLVGVLCHSLSSFQPFGCVLATTTNELMLLVPSQKSISYHPLKGSAGVLSSIGRRMTSLFFGSPSGEQVSPYHKVIACSGIQENSRSLYVLNCNQFFKWEISYTGGKSVQEKCELENMFKSSSVEALLEEKKIPAESVEEVNVWCLDVERLGGGLIAILTGIVVKGPSIMHLFFVIGTLTAETDDIPERLETVNILQFSERFPDSDKPINYRLLCPEHGSTTFIHGPQTIVCVPAYTRDNEVNLVELSPLDAILGAGVFEERALFFSRKNGIIHVFVTEAREAYEFSRVQLSESLRKADLPDVSLREDRGTTEGSGDKMGQFRTAFLQFCQGHIEDARQLCDKLFPEDKYPGDIDVDTAVTTLSQELIDDYPASDPRWAESVPAGGMSSSASLIILHQLEDKLKAHNFLVDFLKGVGIWDKMGLVTVREQPFPTCYLICEHAEKLTAAISLCRIYKKYPDVLDAAIHLVIRERGLSAPLKDLTEQDLFFREVSMISDIFKCLLTYEDEVFTSQPAAASKVETVLAVSDIIQEVIQEAWHYRQASVQLYAPGIQCEDTQTELVLWTATAGPNGVRSVLSKQIAFIAERGLTETDDNKMRSMLFQQIVGLADILLDGYVNQLETLKTCVGKEDRYDDVRQRYEQERRAAILPLVYYKQRSQAVSLAMKYHDFGILIEICEETSDQESLRQYATQFRDQGFSDYLFKWYMDKGQRHKLMSQPEQQHESLARFLHSHQHLSWLHDIQTKDFYKAYKTLKELASKETGYLSKKKTLYSLSKLALLASEDHEEQREQELEKLKVCQCFRIRDKEDKQDIITEHNIILHQETVPLQALQRIKVDVDSMAPMSPKQLIELYVGDNNPNSSEYDFKKALDLIQLATTSENSDGETDWSELKRYVWCRALLKDDWSALKATDPLASARKTVFFKTVQLAFSQGLNLTDFMPPLDSLLEAEELLASGLLDNAQFQFFLKAGYEQIERSTQNTEEMVE